LSERLKDGHVNEQLISSKWPIVARLPKTTGLPFLSLLPPNNGNSSQLLLLFGIQKIPKRSATKITTINSIVCVPAKKTRENFKASRVSEINAENRSHFSTHNPICSWSFLSRRLIPCLIKSCFHSHPHQRNQSSILCVLAPFSRKKKSDESEAASESQMFPVLYFAASA
jgi:hypothetical protein